jgi:hypothetical protein
MRRILVLVFVLSVLLLTGCDTTNLPAGPLRLSDAAYQSTSDSQLAVAIDARGVKHIARVECRTDNGGSCRVIYEAVPGVGQNAYHVYTPQVGQSFRNPDVAVTDSGLAMVVWQNCPAGDPLLTRQCQTYYARNDDLNTVRLLEVGTHSLSAPLAVSRGEVIYALHEVTNGATGSALRYCRITTPLYVCHYASDHPALDDGVRRKDPAAAVSGGGSLQVAWLAFEAGWNNLYTNGNYGALDADMVNKHLRYSNVNLLPPAMAIETDDEYIYIPVASLGGSSDELHIYFCFVNQNCEGGGINSFDLPSEKLWSIESKPAVIARADQAQVAFSATNTDHPLQNQIYLSSNYTPGSFTSVSRPFPTTLASGSSNCDPALALVDGWTSIGWHICGFPPARDDIYFFSAFTGGKIMHDANNYAGRGGLDMAANGKYVAGVWNEIQSDGRIATWLVFNTYLSYVPMVRK